MPLVIALTACGSGTPFPATLTPEPSRTPTPPPGPEVFPTFAPTGSGAQPAAPAVVYDNLWRSVKPGLDVMLMRGRVGTRDELVAVTRIDPTQVQIRVMYDPLTPRYVREWFDATNADAAINAGYFLDTKETTGLLIVNGQPFGTSYTGFGGMFSMRGAQPSIQWLKTQPYQADPSISQAVQAAPMLVQGGKVVQGINDNGERNRRSFVALDRDGRVLLGVSQTASWSLTDLARFLAGAPQLSVRDAMNLDGGASSGMWVRSNIDPALTNSLEAVPSVIVVGGN